MCRFVTFYWFCKKRQAEKVDVFATVSFIDHAYINIQFLIFCFVLGIVQTNGERIMKTVAIFISENIMCFVNASVSKMLTSIFLIRKKSTAMLLTVSVCYRYK